MTDKWWIGKDLEGNGRGLIEELPQHLPGETEEYHERFGGVPVEIRTEHSQNTSQPARFFVFFPLFSRCFMTKSINISVFMAMWLKRNVGRHLAASGTMRERPMAVFCLLWHHGYVSPIEVSINYSAPCLNSIDFIHTPRKMHLSWP
jgi:hypothetical protein